MKPFNVTIAQALLIPLLAVSHPLTTGAQLFTVSTAEGTGSDIEMREQTDTSANTPAINTRTSSAGDRNEIIGLAFDLSGHSLPFVTNVALRLTSFRTDSSTRVVDLYGVAPGTFGSSGFTTETWNDLVLGQFGDLPGLLATDFDNTTQSINGSATIFLGRFTLTGLTEGGIVVIDPPSLTAFLRSYSGSRVTLILAAGNTSSGQFRIASREATELATAGLFTGPAGAFAPVLQFAETSPCSNCPPFVLAQPQNQTVLGGMTARFSIVAGGTSPLSYQWRFNGGALAGATNDTLTLTGVTTNQAGQYSVVVTNTYGSVTSAVATLTVAGSTQQEFQILSLTTSGSAVVDHDAFTGDDRGGIAASASQVLYSGDNATARFRITDLGGGASLGVVRDAMVSDLRTETVYSLGNGATPLTGQGTVTTLLEMDGNTGAMTGRSISLSTPISMSYGSGIFAGYGRVVLHNGNRVYTIELPSGLVVDLGAMSMPAHTEAENWAFWGVAEYFGGSIHLVYVQNFQTIARTRVPGGLTTTLASFSNLSDMACFTVSVPFSRWYFHYEGSAQFGGSSETLGYATALFNVVSTNPPSIALQPQNQNALNGGTATFNVLATGGLQLSYQWRFNGSPLAGATNASLTLTGITTNQVGQYSAVITNAYGSITSAVATLTVISVTTPEFRILSLTANGSSVIDHDALTGDDRGGIAASASQVFYSGDNATARFRITDLGGGASLGVVRDAMVSDLRTETVYSIGNGSIPLGSSGGTVTTLLEMDSNTGALTGRSINLSTPITMSFGAGIFAGYGRVVLHNGSRVYSIELPSGLVLDLGAMPMPVHTATENWAFWGVAEYFGGSVHLVYVQDSQTIARTRVPDGLTTTLASFSYLSDMACITVSIPFNRWYFHYEGSAQFGGSSETMGYATALFDVAVTNPPSIVLQPQSQTVAFGDSVTFEVIASGTQPLGYQWLKNGAEIPGATSNRFTIASAQTSHIGAYSVIVSNAFGDANSAVAMLNVIECVPRLGGTLTASGNDLAITIRLLNTTAAYTSDVYLYANGLDSVWLGSSRDDGRVTTITNPPGGVELEFYIYVRNTGWYFYSGPGSRNPDNLPHAIVHCETNGVRRIGFEDTYGGGDFSYHDVVFDLRELPTPPWNLSPLVSQVVPVGGSTTFSIEASGTAPLFYQWRKDGTNLAGATGASLTLTNVQEADQGSYSVLVTNAVGSAVSTAAFLQVNHPPVANASATATPTLAANNSNAVVTLDGTRSSDPDADPLAFVWYENDRRLGAGRHLETLLPLGTHTILLVVSDGFASSSNTVAVQVLTPTQGLQRLDDLVSSSVPRSLPLRSSLSAAMAALMRGDLTPALNQLHAFQNKIRAQVAPLNPALAEALIQETEALIAALTAGDLRPTSPGALTATPISPFEIVLAWSDTSSNELGFKIERSRDGVNFAQIAQVQPNITYYRNSSLFPDSQYSYRVRAFNVAGDSAYAVTAQARTQVPPCPLSVAAWGYQPVAVPPGLPDVVAVAGGSYHILALQRDGTVVGWGDDASGAGRPPTNLTDVTAIAVGSSYSLALRGNGTVVGWGDNYYAQATLPLGLTNVVAISAGSIHALAVRDDGTVVGWGDNYYGQATPPPNLSGVVAVAAGGNHSLALKSDGTVIGWGYNGDGQATPPPNLSGVIAIAAGEDHSLALRSDGTVVGWGNNDNDQATPPAGLPRVTAIAAGLYHSLALKDDGSVVCWGYNGYGQTTPQEELSTRVVAISDGDYTSMALTTIPHAPSSVAAAIPNTSQIVISWQDNSPAETGFSVERATVDENNNLGPWQHLATVAANVTNYPDPISVTNVTQAYRVSAGSICGGSPYSDVLYVRLTAPDSPYSLSAFVDSTNQVKVRWYYSGAVTGFKIERANDVLGNPGPWTEIGTVAATNSYTGEFSDANVVRSAAYWYRVRAYNGLGASPASDPAWVNVSSPSTPHSVYVSHSANQVFLYWYTSSGGSGRFEVQRARDVAGQPSVFWDNIATVPSSDLSYGEYTDMGLSANTTYWYRVRSINWVGPSTFSSPLSVTISPPEAPIFQNVVVGQPGQVVLNWYHPSQNADGFEIERAPDSGSAPGAWTPLATLNITNYYYVAYTNTGVAPNTIHWYRVRAFNSVGTSPYGNPFEFRAAPPPAAQNPSASSVANRVNLNWYNPDGGLNGYRIERATDVGGRPITWEQVAVVAPIGDSYLNYTDTVLATEAGYWYRVRAFNWVGDAPYSTAVSVTIRPPGTPSSLSANLSATSGVFLSWYQNFQDADGFKIERASEVSGAPGAWAEIATVFATNFYYTTYNDTNVSINTTNWYRVRAFNVVGISDYSDPARIRAVIPSAPSNLYAYVQSVGLVVLSWSSDPDVAAGYKIERAIDSGGAPGPWTSVLTNSDRYATYFYDYNVATNNTYWYRVRAYNSLGDSPYSGLVLARLAPPSPPTNLTTHAVRNQVNLAWTAPITSVDGYHIERAADNAGSPGAWTLIASYVYGTNYTDYGLELRQTYWYRVRSYNVLGESPFSTPRSVFLRADAEVGSAVTDWSDVRQRIDGFGASSAWRSTWSTAQADMFFSTNTGIGLSLLRSRIRPDGGSDELTIMRLARDRGARIWSAPWSPPAGLKDSGTVNGGNFRGGAATNQAYASQLARYVVNMRNQGIDIFALSIQNEPDYNTTSYESCLWSSQQFHDFVPYLYNTLAASNVSSTRIMLPESANWNLYLASDAMNDFATANQVGILAAHGYFSFPSPQERYGKALWETEDSTFDSHDGSMANGIYWADRIHSFLTIAEVNAWHYWWLINSNPSNEGLTDQSGNSAKRMYVLGQFSRFVRPDFYRVGVHNNSTALISAYHDSASPGFAIVAINPNPDLPVIQTFNLSSDTSTAAVTPWITSSNQSLVQLPTVAVTNSTFTYVLPPYTVVTFVGPAQAPAPGVSAAAVVPVVLEITGVTTIGADVLISWQTLGGTRNVVEATADLGEPFRAVSPALSIGGAGGVTASYLDLGAATNNAARFYRIRLEP